MMELFDLGLLKIGIFDILDVVLVAIIIYQIYNLIRGTIAVNIFIGLICVYLLWILVKALNMQLLSAILDKVIGVGVIALVILFQQEIRRFLLIIGKNTFSKKNRFWKRFVISGTVLQSNFPLKLGPVLEACKNMAKSKTGALIVFARTYEEHIFLNNGEILNADISRRLIESIFEKTSPLHDGALIVADNKLVAASAILPLTDNTELPKQLGLRHRSAVGITEHSDAVAVVISEETGQISYASRGKIRVNIPLEELERLLNKDLG
jgi:diadenylate cyclase